MFLPQVPILSQMNPFQIHLRHLFTVSFQYFVPIYTRLLLTSPGPTAFPWVTRDLAIQSFLIRSSEYYRNILEKKKHKLWCSLLCSILEPVLTSSILSPIIFLSSLFSNTLHLCSSLNLRYKVSHTHTKQTGEHIILYILIFTLLDSRREDEGFWTEWTPGSATKQNLKTLLLLGLS
jgi:hypothetical protein